MNQSPKSLTIVGGLGVSLTLEGTDIHKTYDFEVDGRIIDIYDFKRCVPESEIKFNAGQKLVIKRARLVSRGAPGLQTGSDYTYAAKLRMIQGKSDPQSGFVRNAGTDEVPLIFSTWNEWEDKDFELAISGDGSSLGIQAGSEVTCDDFNIQDNFVGQAVYPVVELEAEVYIGD
jgi:hypothetical protein